MVNHVGRMLLRGKYRDINKVVEEGVLSWPYYASSWWQDIMSLEGVMGVDWLSKEVARKLGNDIHTRFWKDVWVGEVPLSQSSPRLFSLSNQKE